MNAFSLVVLATRIAQMEKRQRDLYADGCTINHELDGRIHDARGALEDASALTLAAATEYAKAAGDSWEAAAVPVLVDEATRRAVSGEE